MVTHQGAEGRQNDIGLISSEGWDELCGAWQTALQRAKLRQKLKGLSLVVCRRADPKELVFVHLLHYAQIDD